MFPNFRRTECGRSFNRKVTARATTGVTHCLNLRQEATCKSVTRGL